MVKKCLIFLIAISGIVYGQQLPQYSQFSNNQYMINPAAIGVPNSMNIALGGRMQWVGLDDSPKTSYLYFSTPFNKASAASMKRTFGKVQRNRKSVKHPTMHSASVSHAYGGQIVADQYGPFRTLKFLGTYAVQIPLANDFSMSFGTNVGIGNRMFLSDKAQVLSVMTNTGQFDNTYNAYTTNRGAQNTMDIDAGMYFWGRGVFAGISASQLTKGFVKIGNQDINFDPQIHLFLTGGYKAILNNRWNMTSALLLKYMKPAPLSFEASFIFDFEERFFFGASYRHQDAVIAQLGMTVSEVFEVGYSFDFTISGLSRYNSGGHELVLKYKIGGSRAGSMSKI